MKLFCQIDFYIIFCLTFHSWSLGRVGFTSEANKSRERSFLSEMLRAFTLFAIKTSIVLTFISFRQATLPTERAPFVALRHFPRFIGEIYPIGESKSS